jgi:hypothetical protein
MTGSFFEKSFWDQILGSSWGGRGGDDDDDDRDYDRDEGDWKPSSGTGTTGGTTTTPTTPTYGANNPPPGFSSEQWKRLLDMSKNNTGLADLIKQFTGSIGTTTATDAWRRTLPTDTTQLSRQLSFNAGEMGMPGGYVGAIQMPSYRMGGDSSQQLPPINNPDMSKYGRQPGYGEATFYQQSMKGGMAPIAAMSPLGVPEGWAPGGKDLKSQLEDYLSKLRGGDDDDDDDD